MAETALLSHCYQLVKLQCNQQCWWVMSHLISKAECLSVLSPDELHQWWFSSGAVPFCALIIFSHTEALAQLNDSSGQLLHYQTEISWRLSDGLSLNRQSWFPEDVTFPLVVLGEMFRRLVGWIAMKFGKDIHVQLRMNDNHLGDPWPDFSCSTIIRSKFKCVPLLIKCLQH